MASSDDVASPRTCKLNTDVAPKAPSLTSKFTVVPASVMVSLLDVANSDLNRSCTPTLVLYKPLPDPRLAAVLISPPPMPPVIHWSSPLPLVLKTCPGTPSLGGKAKL